MSRQLQRRYVFDFLLFSPVVLAFLVLAWRWRWTCDDAFVTFRAVANLLAGYGPNFNLHERVESYTNALWMFSLSGLSAVFGLENIELISVVVGILLTGCGILLLMLVPRRALARDGIEADVWLPFFALSLLGIQAFLQFASSGLETGMSFFLIALSLYLAFALNCRHLVWAGLVMSLLPINRPDFAIYLAVFAPYILHRAYTENVDGLRQMLRVAIALVAVPASFQIFRMGYFASLVPNTAFAKEASMSFWNHGFEYLMNFARTYELGYVLPVFFGVGAWLSYRLGSRTLRIAFLLCGLGGLLHGTYVVRVGGDFMHARQLLADHFLLMAPLAALPVLDRLGKKIVVVLVLGMLVWSGVSLWKFRLPYEGTDPKFYINNEYTVWAGILDKSDPINTIQVLPNAPPVANFGSIHIHGNAGIHGFRFAKYGLYDVFFIEFCGLGSPITSRHRLKTRRTIGHEKCREPLDDPWLAARYDGLAKISKADPSDTAIARQILHESVLANYYRAIDEPLTLRLFLENVFRSAAYSRYRLPAIEDLRKMPRETPEDYAAIDRLIEG